MPSRASVVTVVAVELDMHADRDVIGDHRHIDGLAHIAEMIDDLGLAGAGIEGRGHDDGVGAGRLRRPGDDR